MLDNKVTELVSRYGVEVKERLAGVGEPEEALRTPIDHLLTAVGNLIGKKTILDGETHLSEISSRPDFAVRVKGAVVGYIEVKQAGLSLDPSTFKGHNSDQWNRLKDLPNLIYTNGSEWRLYRADDEPVLVAQLTGGPLDLAGSALAPDTTFRQVVTDFLGWHPVPIRTVPKLVRTVAPITRMLRTKVREQLEIEHANVKRGEPTNKQVFLGLASDWRTLLFPDASDEVFADGYAQTVTFALLLAKTEGIDLESTSLHEIGKQLGTEHSLMGKALQLLTQDVTGDFVPTIDLLRRVIGAVVWDAVRKNKDTYLHLYENFLAEYDPELRKATGTYYTPHEVVDQMVRLAEEALVTKLGKAKGFLDPSVTTIDPAMGTGTFLHSIIEHVAEKVEKTEGPGAVPGTITELASRLIGFELQLGSYAVAELRTTDLLRSYDAAPPTEGMRMWTRAVELGREVVWLHTYGESFADKSEARERGNVRDGWPPEAQPLSLEAVKAMPVKHGYDAAKHAIYFTDDDNNRNGVWGPVDQAVFDYTVGGMNVIGSWFKYRKKNPGGKKTSPLDDIHVAEWPHEWTLEFTELLTVLTRLVHLEPAQAELLEQVLAGELITMGELSDAGVKWPVTRDDRKPRRKPADGDPALLDIPEP